jgi:hypothetical protein
MFAIREETLASVIASMKESGYDKSQPLVLWKGKGVVVDGHTRLQAAREAGIAEVPVEEKEFASLEDENSMPTGARRNGGIWPPPKYLRRLGSYGLKRRGTVPGGRRKSWRKTSAYRPLRSSTPRQSRMKHPLKSLMK